MCYHSGPEWTWDQWQWRGSLHSPKVYHHRNLTIRIFTVILPGHSLWGFYPSAEVQSVYSAALADGATGHSLSGGAYPSAEKQSEYCTALNRLGNYLIGFVLFGFMAYQPLLVISCHILSLSLSLYIYIYIYI